MIVPNIILSLLSALILSVVSYCVGYIISCLNIGETDSKQSEAESFFKRMTIGVLTLVTVYALVRTAGVTILAGVAVPVIAVVVRRIRFAEKKPVFALQKFLPSISVLLCFVVVITALVAVSFFSTASLSEKIFDVNQDYAYYASVANNLSEFGVETSNGDFANPQMIAPSMYHYAELWLTAIVSQVSGISLFYTLLLVVFPFLGALALMGVGTLIQKIVGGGYWTFVLGVVVGAMLSVVSFRLLLSQGGTMQITPLGYSSLMMQRFYPIIIGFVFALTLRDTGKTAALCAAGFVYPTIIVPVLAGLAAYLIYEFVFLKRRDFDFWLSCATVVASVLFFVAFYKFTAVPNPYLKESYFALYAFRLAMYKFGTVSIAQYAVLPLADMVVNLAPYVLLLFLMKKEKRAGLIKLVRENGSLSVILLASAFGFAVIWYLKDSVQIYYSVAYPMFLIMNSLIVVSALIKGALPIRAVAILIMIMNIAPAVHGQQEKRRPLNEKFYTEIASVLDADTTAHRFAWVDFKELRSVPDILLRDAAYRKPLAAISRFEDGYSPVRLDVFDIEYDPGDVGDKNIIHSIENNSFYRYTLKNRLQKNISEAQNRYIRENKIRYIVAPRGLNWFSGRGFRVKSVIESDSESYSFYVLDL